MHYLKIKDLVSSSVILMETEDDNNGGKRGEGEGREEQQPFLLPISVSELYWVHPRYQLGSLQQTSNTGVLLSKEQKRKLRLKQWSDFPKSVSQIVIRWEFKPSHSTKYLSSYYVPDTALVLWIRIKQNKQKFQPMRSLDSSEKGQVVNNKLN